MKDYGSAFLSLILVGVVMLVAGLGLIVRPSDGQQSLLADNMQTTQTKAQSAPSPRPSGDDSTVAPLLGR